MRKDLLILVLIIVVVLFGGLWYYRESLRTTSPPSTSNKNGPALIQDLKNGQLVPQYPSSLTIPGGKVYDSRVYSANDAQGKPVQVIATTFNSTSPQDVIVASIEKYAKAAQFPISYGNQSTTTASYTFGSQGSIYYTFNLYQKNASTTQVIVVINRHV